ncbi:2-hydroxyacid dehydrogenase [Sporomusa acidovorans]|uniref:Formate dehydrogenase, mitochondrial n=1 Tax=Sporomusa acidovorans (strain ATCC 49682 / DSM 3132 / Mol) TaxID=1123286 RepID=A0ABZ3J6C3_SPOA4|nr:NAD(P)-dependent oxidoreductase [Sporomusa acidovorans]OZC24295.1 hydroxypyruvate reductase [Sporomusa acidovorans DSM 3132]SDF02739.1 D-3-phosphoglycerate dehydrogenase [Sporomusa acidovorans]
MPTIVSLLSKEKFNSANPIIPAGLDILFPEEYSDNSIINACQGADCLFSSGSAAMISSVILERMPTIKIVQVMGVGFDRVDIPASVRVGIPVANVPGANSTSVAEYVIGSLIALQRRLVEADAEIKAGNFVAFRNRILREGIQEIGGSKIGLVGFGNIARQVAKIASLLGASVSYYATHKQPSEVEQQYSAEYKPLDVLLATSDVISLHVPLTDNTRGMIGAREIALMRRGSILINTARGGVLDPRALAEALEAGQLAGAAIDTFTPEPPDLTYPLLHLSANAAKRLLLTPHTAGVTLGAYKRMIEGAFANMARVIHGETPLHIVNGIFCRNSGNQS